MCFAYYNYQNSQLGNISELLAALIKQLCRRRSSIPPSLLQIKLDALPPSLVSSRDNFVTLAEGLRQVYVIFDALDECPESQRYEILGFITDMLTVTTSCHVKFFITSRREMDLAKAFEGKNMPTIQIRPGNVTADINTFVRIQVEKLQRGQHGKTLYITSEELKEKIIDTLSSKADGM
jgi:hypothetical protein